MNELDDKNGFVPKMSTKILAVAGLLVALEFVFERILVLETPFLRVSPTFIARAVAGTCLGPLYSALIGIVSDFVGCLYKGYAINPGITFAAVFRGLCFGFLLYKKQTVSGILIASALDQFVAGLVITTFSLVIWGGMPLNVASFIPRLIQCSAIFVIEAALLVLTRKYFLIRIKNLFRQISER